MWTRGYVVTPPPGTALQQSSLYTARCATMIHGSHLKVRPALGLPALSRRSQYHLPPSPTFFFVRLRPSLAPLAIPLTHIYTRISCLRSRTATTSFLWDRPLMSLSSNEPVVFKSLSARQPRGSTGIFVDVSPLELPQTCLPSQRLLLHTGHRNRRIVPFRLWPPLLCAPSASIYARDQIFTWQ